MAFVNFGHITVELLDKLGVTTSMQVYISIDPTKTVSAIQSDIQSVVDAIDNATDSQITGVTLRITPTLSASGWKAAPASTAENERTGLFNFKQSVGPYKFGIDLPSIADSLISNGKIDLAAGAITALVNALTVPFTTFEVVSTAISAITALTDALITFRKHRKAESRRSFEVS